MPARWVPVARWQCFARALLQQLHGISYESTHAMHACRCPTRGGSSLTCSGRSPTCSGRRRRSTTPTRLRRWALRCRVATGVRNCCQQPCAGQAVPSPPCACMSGPFCVACCCCPPACVLWAARHRVAPPSLPPLRRLPPIPWPPCAERQGGAQGDCPGQGAGQAAAAAGGRGAAACPQGPGQGGHPASSSRGCWPWYRRGARFLSRRAFRQLPHSLGGSNPPAQCCIGCAGRGGLAAPAAAAAAAASPAAALVGLHVM